MRTTNSPATRTIGTRRAVASIAMPILAVLASGSPLAADDGVRDLFRSVTDSVVVVRTEERLMVGDSMPYERRFSDLGSGVVISADGDVITAAHLVQAADRVEIRFRNGGSVAARVVASEPAADIALLRLIEAPKGLRPARLADSDLTEMGERVIVIGAPYGLEHSLSVGYVSSRHRATELPGPLLLGEFFQTDAAVNRGNSGGPMFNQDGEVIGVVSYILSHSGAFEGIGFAVTANTVRDLLLQRTGFWSGMTVVPLGPDQTFALNLPTDYAVLVQRVALGSIADHLGLRPGILPASIGGRDMLLGGDVILAVDGIEVGDPDAFQALRDRLSGIHAGQVIKLLLYRRGERIERTWKVTADWLHQASGESQ